MFVIQNITSSPKSAGENLIFTTLKTFKEEPDCILRPNATLDLTQIEEKAKKNAEVNLYLKSNPPKIRILTGEVQEIEAQKVASENKVAETTRNFDFDARLSEIENSSNLSQLEDICDMEKDPKLVMAAMKRLTHLGSDREPSPELENKNIIQ